MNTNRNLNSMFFIDNNTGWIVGDSGLILKTTDKGNTWVRQTWNDTIHVNLISVYFLNPDNGFIGTEDNAYGDYYGALLHTTDGGNSWDYEKYYGSIENIRFLNNKFGYIYSSRWQRFTLTKDGGKTWSNPKYNEIHNSIYFKDSLNAFKFNGPQIDKTTDGGNNWSTIQNLNTVCYINKTEFQDSLRGYAVGYQVEGSSVMTLIIKTIDGGNTWNVDSTKFPGILQALDINKNSGIASVGKAGVNIFSDDNGASWDKYFSGINSTIEDVYFVDKDYGWAIGHTFINSRGTIFKTTNGGDDWSVSIFDNPNRLVTSCFVSRMTGWIGGEGILKTTDGGLTWIKQNDKFINSICFTDENNGWAVGNSQILNTTDAGTHWYLYNAGTIINNTFNSIIFINKQVGFICADGYIFKTKDSGKTWNKVSAPQKEYYRVAFSDSLHGNAIGNNYTTCRTTDGGDSWTEQKLDYNPDYFDNLMSIAFRDHLHGTIAGINGTLLNTNDGGKTWEKENNLIIHVIHSIFYVDSTKGWIVGENGAILKFDSQKNTTSIQGFSNSTKPSGYSLEQNYPNPFNPSTNISYRITEGGQVKIFLYDQLGRRIKTLVNKNQSSGEYTISVDMTNYPSGVYFYRIQANGFVKTKKMILIK